MALAWVVERNDKGQRIERFHSKTLNLQLLLISVSHQRVEVQAALHTDVINRTEVEALAICKRKKRQVYMISLSIGQIVIILSYQLLLAMFCIV